MKAGGGTLGRVARAPGLWLTLVLAGWVASWLLGSFVAAVTAASLGDGLVHMPEASLMASLLELLGENRGLVVDLSAASAAAMVLSAGLWTVLSGGILSRLSRPLPASGIAAASVSFLPRIVVTSAWHLLVRWLLIVVVLRVLQMLWNDPWWSPRLLLVGALLLAFCRCALDLARARVVLAGAPGFHPKTALAAFFRAARRPSVLAASMALSLAQWAAVATAYLWTVERLQESGMWVPRVLAAVGVFLGLWRLAVAVREAERGLDPGPSAAATNDFPEDSDR